MEVVLALLLLFSLRFNIPVADLEPEYLDADWSPIK